MKTLLPKLRFPEFQDTEDWEERRMEDIAPLQRGFDLPSDQIKTGNVPIVYSNGIQNFHNTGMAKGPGLVTGRSGTIGKIHFIEEGDYWPHNTSLWVTSFKGNFPKFVYYLYTSIGMSRFAAGSGVPTLNRNYVHAFQACVPTSIDEQQKIADCLTSLDELVTAQSQKVDALQAYKKGLMQNLFPAEGESAPRLRFPEFESTGEWEKTTIGQISENITAGGTPSTLKKEYWNGNIRWMSSGELNYKRVYEVQGRITEIGLQNSSTKIIPSHCVLIGLAGQGKTRGTVAMNMIELCTNQSIAAIFPNEQVYCSDFLYHNLDSRYDELRRISAGDGGRGGLNLQIIKSLKITLPRLLSEQQSIADLLTSIDKQISAQSEIVEMFKAHKEGLMQGLFPSMEEE